MKIFEVIDRLTEMPAVSSRNASETGSYQYGYKGPGTGPFGNVVVSTQLPGLPAASAKKSTAIGYPDPDSDTFAYKSQAELEQAIKQAETKFGKINWVNSDAYESNPEKYKAFTISPLKTLEPEDRKGEINWVGKYLPTSKNSQRIDNPSVALDKVGHYLDMNELQKFGYYTSHRNGDREQDEVVADGTVGDILKLRSLEPVDLGLPCDKKNSPAEPIDAAKVLSDIKSHFGADHPLTVLADSAAEGNGSAASPLVLTIDRPEGADDRQIAELLRNFNTIDKSYAEVLHPLSLQSGGYDGSIAADFAGSKIAYSASNGGLYDSRLVTSDGVEYLVSSKYRGGTAGYLGGIEDKIVAAQKNSAIPAELSGELDALLTMSAGALRPSNKSPGPLPIAVKLGFMTEADMKYMQELGSNNKSEYSPELAANAPDSFKKLYGQVVATNPKAEGESVYYATLKHVMEQVIAYFNSSDKMDRLLKLVLGVAKTIAMDTQSDNQVTDDKIIHTMTFTAATVDSDNIRVILDKGTTYRFGGAQGKIAWKITSSAPAVRQPRAAAAAKPIKPATTKAPAQAQPTQPVQPAQAQPVANAQSMAALRDPNSALRKALMSIPAEDRMYAQQDAEDAARNGSAENDIIAQIKGDWLAESRAAIRRLKYLARY